MTSDFKGATVVLCAEEILHEQSALNPALSYTVHLCFSFLQYPTRLLSYIHSIYILQPKRLRLAAPGHPQGLHPRVYRLSVWLLRSGSATLLPSISLPLAQRSTARGHSLYLQTRYYHKR